MIWLAPSLTVAVNGAAKLTVGGMSLAKIVIVKIESTPILDELVEFLKAKMMVSSPS